MLKIEDLSAWLKAAPRSVTEPINLGLMQDHPATVVALTDYGGFGLTVEEAFDNPTFQVRCRGPGTLEARNLAHRIDGLLLDAARPFSLSGAWVLGLTRAGGAPAFLSVSEGKGWVTYVCNYRMEIRR